MNVRLINASDVSIGGAALCAIVGFIIVLAVLALLVGIFYLSGYLFKSDLLNKKKAKPKEAAAEQVDTDEDEETVAAITAAIAVMLEGDGETAPPEFVIRRITRTR